MVNATNGGTSNYQPEKLPDRPTSLSSRINSLRHQLQSSSNDLKGHLAAIENVKNLQKENQPSFFEKLLGTLSKSGVQKQHNLARTEELLKWVNTKMLVQHHRVDILKTLAPYNSNDIKNMFKFIKEKKIEELRILLKKLPALVDEKLNGKSALQEAIETSSTPHITSLLLESGASPNVLIKYKNSFTTPLMLSLQLNKPHLALALLNIGNANPLQRGKISDEFITPITLALRSHADPALITSMLHHTPLASPEGLNVFSQIITRPDAAQYLTPLKINFNSHIPEVIAFREIILREGRIEAINFLNERYQFTLSDINKLIANDRVTDKTIIKNFLVKSDKREIFRYGTLDLIKFLLKSELEFNKTDIELINNNDNLSNEDRLLLKKLI